MKLDLYVSGRWLRVGETRRTLVPPPTTPFAIDGDIERFMQTFKVVDIQLQLDGW